MAQLTLELDRRMSSLGLAPIGVRKNGRLIWPIIGAEDNPPVPPAPPVPPTPPAPPAPTDPGFPANTPLEQMTVDQREAYWRHQARRHEDRNKALGGVTPEQLAELREKAQKHDALELELGSTADKAAAKAAEEAKTATRAELEPEIIAGKLDAAAARAGISEEDLAKAIEFTDTKKLLGADGKVDPEKIKAFIATITPATGTSTTRTGPSPTGSGPRPPAKLAPGDGARAALAARGIKID